MSSVVLSLRARTYAGVAASLLVLATAARAQAGLVASFEVGRGSNASHLQFDFANGNSYAYVVHWDGETTGRDLFDIVSAAQPGYFVADIVSFSFGDALYSQSIGADMNAGFGTPPDYLDFWHYWTREQASEPWTSSLVGFADRIVSNGSWDGWVFGSDNAPSAVPAPASAVVLLCLLRTRRRAR